MKLWKISQDVNNDWETYDSAVVAAEDEVGARLTHPDPWDHVYHLESGDWAPINDIKVEYIGEAKLGTKPGVIVASYNAG